MTATQVGVSGLDPSAVMEVAQILYSDDFLTGKVYERFFDLNPNTQEWYFSNARAVLSAGYQRLTKQEKGTLMNKNDEDLQEAVEIFKAAWESADRDRLVGHRVEAGIRALMDAGWIKHDGTLLVP